MNDGDLTDLARLHVACLADSNVAAMGPAYVRAFYRYVTRSATEIAVVDRGDDGRIVAAAVVSLAPANMSRRLLLRTPLLLSVLRHATRTFALLCPTGGHGTIGAADISRVPPTMPELILLFTSPGERARGRASALLQQLEQRLRARDVAAYQVKTVADPSNPALAFYARKGFAPAGLSFTLGRRFQVFTRTL